MRNWLDASDYAFLERCKPEIIAWEFLRRNPDYQQDYLWFITLWNELETQYGSPPNRNFNAWKKDPRAYRAEQDIYTLSEVNSSVEPDACLSENNNLLIECWMGTKWGFYKFPLSPDNDSPIVGNDLTWRTNPSPVKLIKLNNKELQKAIKINNIDNKVAIIFNLQKDLKAQLDNAKQQLIVTKKNTVIKTNWVSYFRLLDALHNKNDKNEIQAILKLNQNSYNTLKKQALDYRTINYLDIID